jgi:tetratricopeptide (TPR) repeat protein
VFAQLRERPEIIVEVARALDTRIVVNVFLSIVPAYQALRDFTGAIELLEKIRAGMSPKQADYVLVLGNIAALQMQAGNATAAEATLDGLFAMDWSRFDYRADSDGLVAKLLGGSLDAEFARAFRIYFGMAKFNIACIYAQTQRHAQAVAALREATKLNPPGYPAAMIRAEADLAPLAGDPAFEALIGGLS